MAKVPTTSVQFAEAEYESRVSQEELTKGLRDFKLRVLNRISRECNGAMPAVNTDVGKITNWIYEALYGLQ